MNFVLPQRCHLKEEILLSSYFVLFYTFHSLITRIKTTFITFNLQKLYKIYFHILYKFRSNWIIKICERFIYSASLAMHRFQSAIIPYSSKIKLSGEILDVIDFIQHHLERRPVHRNVATSEVVGRAPKNCNSDLDEIFKWHH